MKVDAKLDFDRVPRGEPVTLRLMVSLRPEARPQAERRALNVAVVIDRSGSMSGGKLEDVKEATRTLFRALGPDDTFSLAAFDSRVYPILPPSRVARVGSSAEAAIVGLRTGSNTNLCGGYEQGCRFAVEAGTSDRVSRVLLLTDGLVNEGIIEPLRIAEVVEHYRSLGVGTSTVGVGADYNEELLGLMAERGGGATYFLRTAAEATEVFREELGDLFSVDAADVKVGFAPAKGLRLGQLNTYAVEGDGVWRIGDLFGTQPRFLVLEIGADRLDPADGGAFTLGQVEVRWRQATEGGFEPASLVLPVSVGFAAKEDLAGARPDHEVTLQAAFLLAARAIERSLRTADEGRFDQAGADLETCAEYLDRLGLGEARLDEVIADLRARARRLKEEREFYYDALERKSMYMHGHYMSRGHFAKLAAMQARHGQKAAFGPRAPGGPASSASAGSGRQEVYPCYNLNGHLLAEIGPERALIDTGAPVSLGKRPSFLLLGRDVALQSSFQGASVDDIGRLVGNRITVLLGSDAMNRFDVRLEGGTVSFAEGEMPLAGNPLPLDFFQGVPVVTATVCGGNERFFFDTGAKLSYLHSALVRGLPTVDTDRDFLLGFGEFDVNVFEQAFLLGGRQYRLRCASLPPLLETALTLANVKGILGSALCEGGPVVYAPRRRLLSLG